MSNHLHEVPPPPPSGSFDIISEMIEAIAALDRTVIATSRLCERIVSENARLWAELGELRDEVHAQAGSHA